MFFRRSVKCRPWTTTRRAGQPSWLKRSFTISLPERWQLDPTRSMQDGSHVVFADPADPEIYVMVYTHWVEHASRDYLAGMWQFGGRNPQPISADDVHEGLRRRGNAHGIGPAPPGGRIL